MRTIVDIPEELIASLDRLRLQRSCSRAAVIREALAEYAKKNATGDVEQAFGLWKERAVDGLDYQARLRSEWGDR